MTSPAYCRQEAFEAFRRGLSRIDTSSGLFEAAVAIAQHAHPEESAAEAAAAINNLGSAVERGLRSDSDEARLAHLHDLLFEIAGFCGDEKNYYLPENSYLPSVLRTKRGIPITLTLVYKLVAERIGLAVQGVNAPGHFLAAVRCRERSGMRQIYVDPFYGGGLLTMEEAFDRIRAATGQDLHPDPALLRPATPRAWLSRMLLNLQAIFSRQGSERDVYAMQELQACLNELDR